MGQSSTTTSGEFKVDCYRTEAISSKAFRFRQIIIWQRDGGINFNAGYFLPTYEVIYLIAKPEFRLAPKANSLGDVWKIPQESHNPHPAPFPVELAQRCIQSATANIVLDPFLGSGTTAIAAGACNRHWVGLEVSKDYCKVARERIKSQKNFTGGSPIVSPPTTKKELFKSLIEIVQHGTYTMPATKYSGTGGPGLYLEDLLGLTTGSKDIPTLWGGN